MKALCLGLVAAGLLMTPGAWAGAPDYTLRPEWTGPCKRMNVIDINLGNDPEAFVAAASCQVSGLQLYPEHAEALARQLRDDPKARREDIVRDLCQAAGRTCTLAWSDPWTYGPEHEAEVCQQRYRRDIGAVMMFFFQCPDGSNCAMDWASNHVRGMDKADASLGWGEAKEGAYNPQNPSFWRRELWDAKAAGLQFILPNVYGPDMQDRGEIKELVKALQAEHEPVKVGLFDDTWAWGRAKSGAAWATAPKLDEPDASAKILYESKWKPFFSQLPPENWYRIDNRPVIYFYNAGTLKPLDRAAGVIARMKALFTRDFGVEPFVAVDDAFFADPAMENVADSRFRWDTFSDFSTGTVSVMEGLSRSLMSGKSLTNAVVRWDSYDRDHRGKPAGVSLPWDDRRIKGPERLQDVLSRTHDDDSLLIATWNDLGEGTGINAAYDYYYKGAWQAPDTFMQLIRKDNCQN